MSDSTDRDVEPTAPTLNKRPKLWIRAVESEGRVQGKFSYKLSEGGREKQISFNRYYTEPVGQALERLKANLMSKSVNKRKKKKASAAMESAAAEPKTQISVTLLDQTGDEVSPEMHNCNAWVHGGVLKVDKREFVIEVNCPVVHTITLPRVSLSGHPTCPYFTVEFAKIDQCEFTWYRILDNAQAVVVGREMIYTPSPEDVGHRLKVTVVPKCGDRAGEQSEVETGSPVVAGPKLTAVEQRRKYTAQPCQSGRYVLRAY